MHITYILANTNSLREITYASMTPPLLTMKNDQHIVVYVSGLQKLNLNVEDFQLES
jgi:hypothetical protein